jgi:hypothetical protein
MLNIISGILAPQVPTPVNDYESIATTTLGSSAATITFSSIPATYTHLQVRGIARDTSAGTTEIDIIMRYNGDSATNYAFHYLYGNGSVAGGAGLGTRSDPRAGLAVNNGAAANIFGVVVADILDYKSTNKYKTTQVLAGTDRNGGGTVVAESTLWMNTAAITQIDLTVSGGSSFTANSQFALYGIKG